MLDRILTLLATVLIGAALQPSATGQDFFDRGTLRTLELTFAQADWEDQLRDNKKDGLQVQIPADLVVDGVLYPNVGVRYKGNSTYWLRANGEKAPFNIDLKGFGIDQEVLGNSKIILNNQWSDTSLMREVIAYRVLNEFTPSSRANFIKLVINGDNYGIYTNVEHIGGKFTERWFGNEDGFRYKAVPPDNWEDTITQPPPPRDLALQDLSFSLSRAERAYELKNLETDPLHHLDVLTAIDVLNNTLSADLLDALNPLVDTDQAIWHLALNNAICSLDAYYDSGRNYYLYHDPKHDLLSVIPWDFNMAFGNYGNAPNTMSPTKGAGDSERPLLSNLVEGGVLRQQYLAHIAVITEFGLDPAVLHAEIDALMALIDAEVRIDTRLAQNYQQFVNGVNSLKNFIGNRHAFLDSHNLIDLDRPQFSAVGHAPATPKTGEAVLFSATVDNPNDPIETAFVHYRSLGAFIPLELFDDGAHGDGAAGDGVYANTAPGFVFGAPVEYYFEAKLLNSNGMAFEPMHASFKPLSFSLEWGGSTSDIVLNEFVAKNNNGPVDEAGQAEDWIELHNRGNAAVDISGLGLADQLGDATPWPIPAGTSLAPGESLLIWADKDPLDGPMHADFKLSSGGEEVVLYATDGLTVLDFVVFGAQQADVATTRLHDGEELWVTSPDTTPGASNNIGCGTRAYNALDAARNTASLALVGTPSIGTSVDAQMSGFAAGQVFNLLVGGTATMQDHAGSGLSLLVGSNLNVLRLTADAGGNASASLPIPANASLVGMSVYLQAGTQGANAVATHALEVVICP
jgi:CotH kinase protein/Lamin Tail Domain